MASLFRAVSLNTLSNTLLMKTQTKVNSSKPLQGLVPVANPGPDITQAAVLAKGSALIQGSASIQSAGSIQGAAFEAVPSANPADSCGAIRYVRRGKQRPTLAARVVRGLFLTTCKPGVPNLAILARTVSSHIRRWQGVDAKEKGVEVPAVIVLTGPSGGGKSVLLRAIERELLRSRRARTMAWAGSSGRAEQVEQVEQVWQTEQVGQIAASARVPRPGNGQAAPLIVRADLLRHAVFVQGMSCRAVLREKRAARNGVAAVAPHHSGALAVAMLACDPPVDPAALQGSEGSATSRAAFAAARYHTRIQPDDVRAVHQWLACLASAGLADAGVLLMPLHKLSTGQRARHTLAVAMHRCTRLHLPAATESDGLTSSQAKLPDRRVLLVDELGSALDAITAVSVAISLRRWGAANNVVLVVATADQRIVNALKAQLEVELPLHSGPAGARGSGRGGVGP